MLKEYLIKVVKKQFIKVKAINKATAKQIAEEMAMVETKNDELVGSKVIDIMEVEDDEINVE